VESFQTVETQTTEFQDQCEGILADQKRSSNLADEIAENLQYYNYLDPITKRLNAPGAGSLVRRSEFPEMLANLDACLDYMNSHVRSHISVDWILSLYLCSPSNVKQQLMRQSIDCS
jgi:conserved oligomeric Golgi complex subunit 3